MRREARQSHAPSVLTTILLGWALFCRGETLDTPGRRTETVTPPARAESRSAQADTDAGTDPAVILAALYPTGVPPRENPFDARQQPPEVLVLAVATLPETPARKAVLYAERFPSPIAGEDSFHSIFVAVVSLAPNDVRTLDRHDLTRAIRTVTEAPGHFFDVTGQITTLELPDGRPGIDVSARVRLAGSGGIADGTDWLYRVTAAGKLEHVLTLTGTSTYWASGTRRWEDVRSALLIEKKPGKRLLVAPVARSYAARDEEGEVRCVTGEIAIYRFEQGRYVHAGSMSASALEPARSSFIPIPRLESMQVQPCQ
jgi:hypothetical protein